MRTVLDELATPLPQAGNAAALVQTAWNLAGQPQRADQHGWRPFEDLPVPAQAQTLTAAATTLHALEDGRLTGRGRHTGLLRPTNDATPRRSRPAGCNRLLTTGEIDF